MKPRKTYVVTMVCAEEPACTFFIYIEASSLKQRGHETIIADGVRIDLPGDIKKIVEKPIKKLAR